MPMEASTRLLEFISEAQTSSLEREDEASWSIKFMYSLDKIYI